MANIPNFLNAPLLEPKGTDMLGEILQGFKGSQVPQQYQRAYRQDDLSAENLSLANALKEIERQYAVPTKEKELQNKDLLAKIRQQELSAGDINLQYLPEEKRQQLFNLAGQGQLQQQQLQAGELSIQDAKEQARMRQQASQAISNALQNNNSTGVGSESDDAKIIQKGNENLYHLDHAIDTNPHLREQFKKQGIQLKQDIKTNDKSGKTILTTEYPSGRITQRTISDQDPNYIPLTDSAKTATHKRLNAMEKLDKLYDEILEMEPYSKIGTRLKPYDRSEVNAYNSAVNRAIELQMVYAGTPMTDKGTQMAEHIIRMNPTDNKHGYRNRIRSQQKVLKEDIREARQDLTKGASKGESQQKDESTRKMDSRARPTKITIGGRKFDVPSNPDNL